ncbi:hypothetical protein ACGFRG_25655 [Streptomyces sp. NPDC048696]|uniref:hypothetical protein n=1 Tax=Streptomyces sp. NPDC048696 TaxID=3365585 RepID=UPI003715E865
MAGGPGRSPAPCHQAALSMIQSLRAATVAAVAAAVAALALSGCGAPTGLSDGGAAPPVAAQPSPKPLWPDWSDGSRKRPGPAVPGAQPPPEPLAHGPAVPKEGLSAIDVDDVIRADPRAKQFGGLARSERPGQPGIRPPVLRDLTDDGSPELIISADLESGRTVLAVYTARDGKVVPILYTAGKRLAVETVGTDLVVRSASDDGAEQDVRYRWDGARLSSVSDIKTYKNDDADDAAGADGTDRAAKEAGP